MSRINPAMARYRDLLDQLCAEVQNPSGSTAHPQVPPLRPVPPTSVGTRSDR